MAGGGAVGSVLTPLVTTSTAVGSLNQWATASARLVRVQPRSPSSVNHEGFNRRVYALSRIIAFPQNLSQ